MSLKSLLFARRYYFLIRAYNLLANFMWVCVHACIILVQASPHSHPFYPTKGTTEIMNDKPFFWNVIDVEHYIILGITMIWYLYIY